MFYINDIQISGVDDSGTASGCVWLLLISSKSQQTNLPNPEVYS